MDDTFTLITQTIKDSIAKNPGPGQENALRAQLVYLGLIEGDSFLKLRKLVEFTNQRIREIAEEAATLDKEDPHFEDILGSISAHLVIGDLADRMMRARESDQ